MYALQAVAVACWFVFHLLQAMLESSRETCSGIQLEVNEKILDSCNQLMKVVAIFGMILVITCKHHTVLTAVIQVNL